jgi:sn-glycerol 3-phosphate transport system permease protein
MKKYRLEMLFYHTVLLSFAFIIVFPFLWMFFSAFKTQSEIFTDISLLPDSFRLDSFTEVLATIPFAQYFKNTLKFVFGLLCVQFLTITFAAYAFARFRFPFKDVLFTLLLLQLMIAPQTLVVPNYIIIKNLKLLDTVTAISLPYVASAMGVFLLRQAFRSIPSELEEAAVMDGASIEYYLFKIAIPLIKPSYTAFALVSINFHWNEFFWPLIVTDTVKSRVLTVGLAMFAESSESAAAWNDLMAATLLVAAPLVVIFLLFQKTFVESFMTTGLKT